MKINFQPIVYHTFAAVTAGVAIVGLGTSIAKGISASKAEKRAKAEGDKLKRPFEKVQDEYFQNQNLAKETAMSGLSVDEKGFMQSQRDRALGSSLDAITKTSASPNDIARLNDIYGQSLRSESAQDAQLHLQNIQYLIGANKDIAGQKTTQWGVNEYQPFESKLKEIQDRRIAAQTNKNNAINEGIGSLTAIGTAVGGFKGDGGKVGSLSNVDTPVETASTNIDTGGGVGDPSLSNHPDLTFNQ